MGQIKNRTKGAKKRNKGKRALFAAEERREEVRAPIEQDDPTRTVREARARRMSVEPNGWVLAPEFESDAGRAIFHVARDKDEAGKLWQIFKAFDHSHHRFSARINGIHRFPKVMKLEYMHERFETRDDDRPDLRDHDEKDRDARNSWSQWRDAIGKLPWYHRKAILDAVWTQGTDNILSKGGKATTAGHTLVAALRGLRDEVD